MGHFFLVECEDAKWGQYLGMLITANTEEEAMKIVNEEMKPEKQIVIKKISPCDFDHPQMVVGWVEGSN